MSMQGTRELGATDGPSADARPAAPHRRARWLIAVLAALTLCGAGLGIWWWQRPADPMTEATEAAIRQVAASGGPKGWSATEPVQLFSGLSGGTARQQRGGLDFAVNDVDGVKDAFIVTWTTTATPATAAASCDALAAWMAQVVQDPDSKDAADSCRAVIGKPPNGETSLFTSYGTEPGPDGRYMVAAAARAQAPPEVALYVNLDFEAQDSAA